MLGYDLYSSALADILSEPTMQPPICVGLYAQWGSGKSFLLKKLEGKSLNDLQFFKPPFLADWNICQVGFAFLLPSPPTDEMKTFAGQQIEPLFQFSWLVVFLTLLLCGSVAVLLGFTVNPKLAIAVSLTLLAVLYIFFGMETNVLLKKQFYKEKDNKKNICLVMPYGQGALWRRLNYITYLYYGLKTP